MQQWLPSPYRTPSSAPLCDDVEDTRILIPDYPLAYQRWIPLDNVDFHNPEAVANVQKAIACAAMRIQKHERTETCKKNDHLGTDDDCRMSYPRILVKNTYMDATTSVHE